MIGAIVICVEYIIIIIGKEQKDMFSKNKLTALILCGMLSISSMGMTAFAET